MLISGYAGYTKDKRRATDLALRQEIGRAAGRARSHLENAHDQSYKDGNLKITRSCKQAIEEADQLINETTKAETGGDHGFFSSQKAVSKGSLKKLVKHDHDVVDMVTKAVNLANSTELGNGRGDDEAEVIGMARQCQQMLSSARGFFGARSAIIQGLKRT